MVTAKAREAVADYLAARGDPSPALFISFQPAVRGKRENRLSDEGARHICHQLAKRLGIPPFHPHQLRHTLGTLLQETVGDARLTADTLGHVGLASVAGYTKITKPPAPGAGRDGTARAIDSTISGQASTFRAHANRHAPRR
jgi:integrase